MTTSLNAVKAGSAAVDPSKFNALVDAVETLQSAGGGSQPEGVLTSADFLFTEQATAGTYTATMPIPAGTVVFDVIAYSLAIWALDGGAGDTAQLSVGDGDEAVGYMGFDLLSKFNSNPPYTRSYAQWGSSYSDVADTGSAYANTPYGGFTGGEPGSGARYDADDMLTIELVTTIDSPPVVPTGVLLVKVIYFTPPESVQAVFA